MKRNVNNYKHKIENNIEREKSLTRMLNKILLRKLKDVQISVVITFSKTDPERVQAAPDRPAIILKHRKVSS